MRFQLTVIITILSLSIQAQYPDFEPLFNNHVHNTNEPIIYVDSAYQLRPDLNNWEIKKIYKVNERNNEGKVLLGNVYNSESGDFELSENWNVGYINAYDLSHFTKEFWFSDSADWMLSGNQEWDMYGKLLEKKVLSWSIIPHASIGQGDFYLYDTLDNVIEEKVRTWNPSRGWRNALRRFSEYDSLGNIIVFRFENWDVDSNEWVGITKIEYFYENDLNTYCFVYSWNTDLSMWVKTYKRTNIFDNNNLPIEIISYHAIDDSTYRYYNRKTYSYNQLDMVLEETEERYDTVSNSWKNFRQYSRQYLNDSLISFAIGYGWDLETGVLRNIFRTNWEYNAEFNINHIYFESGNDLLWVNAKQEFYDYNYDGKITSYEKQRWKYDINQQGYWAYDYREEYFWPDMVGEHEYADNVDDIIFYPNPVFDYFNIVCKSGVIKSIRVLTVSGKEVYNSNESSKEISLDMSYYPNGIYLVNISIDSKTISKKVIIQR